VKTDASFQMHPPQAWGGYLFFLKPNPVSSSIFDVDFGSTDDASLNEFQKSSCNCRL